MKLCCGVALILVGCSTDLYSTRGELDRLDFQINASGARVGDHCFNSCAVDHPLMLGTVETISVTTPKLTTFLHGTSSNANVLTVEDDVRTCCSGTCSKGDRYDECLAEGKEASYSTLFVVTAVGVGTSLLELRTATDEVYDRLALDVHAPHSIELQLRDRDDGELVYRRVDTLELAGKHVEVRAIVRDRDGDWMFATSGVTMQLPDMDVAAFYGKQAAVDTMRSEIWPLARGTDTLVLRAGSANRDVTVVSR